MNRVLVIVALLVSISATATAQTGLPKLKKGESYKSVRAKMIRAGWSPFRIPEADKCPDGDARCKGRPEMYSCAGTGMANCAFSWKKGNKFVTILTIGEIAVYSGYRNGRP